MSRAKTKIVARDCMPFYKGKAKADNAIREDTGSILTEFANSIIPVNFLDNDFSQADDESKLAYSPFENKPYPFRDNEEVNYCRVWQAGRYIGSTTIKGTTIEISPRFGDAWIVSILEDLFHFRLTENEYKSLKGGLHELMRHILWHLWVRKFAAADQYGLPRRVVKRTHQGLQIRGHLNIRKSTIPVFTKGQVISEYREKEIDDTICRIVYKAYSILIKRKMNKFKVPAQIQNSLNGLYSYYQGQPIGVSEHDYHDINYKSIYLSWKPLVDFSWQIIQQEAFNQFKDKVGDSYSIFLDMAEIWESFLRKKLGEGFANDGWRVLSIEECTYQLYRGKFYQRDIIPDIILEREQNGQKEYMVFDAKYKRMRGIKSSLKYSDVDRSDLFQIHTYMQYVQQNMGKVVIGGLLYPITQKGTNDDGTAFENTDIDMESYHSTHLFGDDGKDDTTPFIIDGILFSEVPEVLDNESLDEQKIRDESRRMAENIGQMIKRIKQTANL
ncbi:MAG: hypothetical protein IJ610_08180 [Bacteroidaceae bacterium]|nr:hypothetical protein [Bacteroidaceae bacterium]